MSVIVTSVHDGNGLLRVYINDALHMLFSTKDAVGITSWLYSRNRSVPLCVIEVTPAQGAEVRTEYDDETTWRAVLGEINKAYGPAIAARPATVGEAADHG